VAEVLDVLLSRARLLRWWFFSLWTVPGYKPTTLILAGIAGSAPVRPDRCTQEAVLTVTCMAVSTALVHDRVQGLLGRGLVLLGL